MAGDAGVLTISVEGNVALLLCDSPPVNALSHRVRIALHEALQQTLADAAVRAVVIACAGRTFFAGADVTELNRPIEPPLIGDLIAAIEVADKPVVAALHGTALGGGFELALACHYRVAAPSAKVGLPEVALGLLPGAGGTQRLPRLAGLAGALEMIGLGKPVTGARAVELGLVDALVEEEALASGGVAFARSLIARGAPLRRVRDLAVNVDEPAAEAMFSAFRAAYPELFTGLKAADGVLRALHAAVTLPFDAGLQEERSISRALTASPESAAQRHIFFAERAAAKVPGAERLKARPVSVLHLSGGGATEASLTALARMAGVTITDDPAAADLIVTTAAADGDAVRFTAWNGLIEVSVAPDVAPQQVLDAMALARRLAGAAILVRGQESSILAPLVAIVAAAGEDDHARRAVASEALRLLGAGAAVRDSDIDFAMVRTGHWPVWLGGPVYWIAQQEGRPGAGG